MPTCDTGRFNEKHPEYPKSESEFEMSDRQISTSLVETRLYSLQNSNSKYKHSNKYKTYNINTVTNTRLAKFLTTTIRTPRITLAVFK